MAEFLQTPRAIVDRWPRTLNKVAVLAVCTLSGYLNATVGKSLSASNEEADPTGQQGSTMSMFERSENVDGDTVQVRMTKEVPTPQRVGKLAAQQQAQRARSFNADKRGMVEFDLAQFVHWMDIPKRLLDTITGNTKRTVNFTREEFDAVIEGFYQLIAADLGGNTPIDDQHVGGLYAMVRSDNTYAGINRATAGNEFFQAEVRTGTGTYDIHKIWEAVDRQVAKNAQIRLAIARGAAYSAARKAVNQAFQPMDNDDVRRRYGGEYFMVGKVQFVQDAFLTDSGGSADTTSVYYIDPRSVHTVFMKRGFDVGDMMRDPFSLSNMSMPIDLYMQQICKNPRLNTKDEGVS